MIDLSVKENAQLAFISQVFASPLKSSRPRAPVEPLLIWCKNKHRIETYSGLSIWIRIPHFYHSKSQIDISHHKAPPNGGGSEWDTASVLYGGRIKLYERKRFVALPLTGPSPTQHNSSPTLNLYLWLLLFEECLTMTTRYLRSTHTLRHCHPPLLRRPFYSCLSKATT